MPRFGLRVRDSYPYGDDCIGEISTYGNSSYQQVEKIRRDMTTGEHYEVVELNDQGEVVER